MDSSVVSDLRNGISGGNLHLRGKGTVFFGKGHQEDANMQCDEVRIPNRQSQQVECLFFIA